MEVIHDFFVLPAKHIFLADSGELVVARDGLRVADARNRGLFPTLLYSLVQEEVGLSYFQLVAWNDPASIRAFFVSAWSKGFASLPDYVKIGARFDEHMPWLPDFLRQQKVEPVIVTGKDKRYSSYQRTAQRDSLYLAWHSDPPRSLSEFNTQAVDNFRIQCALLAGDSSKVHEFMAYRDYLEQRRRVFVVANTSYAVEFQPGDWLLTNQTSIPPALPDADLDANEEAAADPKRVFYAQEEVKYLLPFWPEPRRRVLQAIGLSSSMFNWYLSNKQGISPEQADQVMRHFGLRWGSPAYDGYCSPEPNGSYVLVASASATSSQLHALHDFLNYGGDGQLGCEVLPTTVRADPSWRFFLDGSAAQWFLIVLPRGSRVAAVIDECVRTDSAFYNMTLPVAVPDVLYRALVALLPLAADFNTGGMLQMKFKAQWGSAIWGLEQFVEGERPREY